MRSNIQPLLVFWTIIYLLENRMGHVMNGYWFYNLQTSILKQHLQQLFVLSNHQSVSNSMSVNLLIKRCIKWISRSVCVLRRTEDPGRSSTSKRNHPITRPHVGQIPPLWQSCCHLHSAAESQNQKAGTSKSCQEFFFPLIISFLSFQPLHPPQLLIINQAD